MSKVCTTCSRRGTERSNPQGEAREGESVSRNASELASAPLDYPRVAKLPIKLKPATAEEEAYIRTQRTLRGVWRQRAEKERSRNLRGPALAKGSRESEGPIVARKWRNGH